jgi:hypothetical protein
MQLHYGPGVESASNRNDNQEWRMASSGMLGCVALVITDVLEELSAPLIMVTRIGELGTTLVVTSNRRTLQRNLKSYINVLFYETYSSLKMETLYSFETSDSSPDHTTLQAIHRTVHAVRMSKLAN